MELELECVQINLQKGKVASTELQLPKLGDVALIQEPYVKSDKVRWLDINKGYVLAARGAVRTAIYVRKDLEAWLVEEFTSEDLTVCTIKMEGRSWYLASLYLDINHSISRFDKLTKSIT